MKHDNPNPNLPPTGVRKMHRFLNPEPATAAESASQVIIRDKVAGEIKQLMVARNLVQLVFSLKDGALAWEARRAVTVTVETGVEADAEEP